MVLEDVILDVRLYICSMSAILTWDEHDSAADESIEVCAPIE